VEVKDAITDKEIEKVGMYVIDIAIGIFKECGKEEDFCIQYVGGSSIVFGGWNRVILNSSGWSLSESHCSEEFINNFNKKFKK